MPEVILLTAAQADTVRGPSEEAEAAATLQPIALTDGRFYVGVEVLDDPAHDAHRDVLAALPTVDFAILAAFLLPPEHG